MHVSCFCENGIEYALSYNKVSDQIKLNITEHKFHSGIPNILKDTWVSVRDMDTFKSLLMLCRPKCYGLNTPYFTDDEITLDRSVPACCQSKLGFNTANPKYGIIRYQVFLNQKNT